MVQIEFAISGANCQTTAHETEYEFSVLLAKTIFGSVGICVSTVEGICVTAHQNRNTQQLRRTNRHKRSRMTITVNNQRIWSLTGQNLDDARVNQTCKPTNRRLVRPVFKKDALIAIEERNIPLDFNASKPLILIRLKPLSATIEHGHIDIRLLIKVPI